jgi:hypothetical protein
LKEGMKIIAGTAQTASAATKTTTSPTPFNGASQQGGRRGGV